MYLLRGISNTVLATFNTSWLSLRRNLVLIAERDQFSGFPQILIHFVMAHVHHDRVKGQIRRRVPDQGLILRMVKMNSDWHRSLTGSLGSCVH